MRLGKSQGLGLAVIALAGVTIFAFQNCAPEQYFRAVKLDHDETTNGSSVTPPTPPTNRYYITAGEFKTTDVAKAGGMAIGGRMMMVRDTYSGTTESFVHAMGLPASTPATIHVHNLPCGVAGGGGHYQIDATGAVDEVNEIWPRILATDVNGVGSGYARHKHYARPEAQSMVIHDAVNATQRNACGLMHAPSSSSVLGGSFVKLTSGGGLVPNAAGNAAIARLGADNLTVVRLSLDGLLPATTYSAHVHALPCATSEGGGHYKQNNDITEVAATANNEIWVPFTTTAAINGSGGGHGETRVQVPHVARMADVAGSGGAVSIVIHDPTAASTARLLCVDLSLPLSFVNTSEGNKRYPTLGGSAKMERLSSGETRVSVSGMKGLTPNATYKLHVHDRPCHVNGGGGHYKHDYSNPNAVEENEVWLTLKTDAAGGGSATFTSPHILRPEAYSIVIHDTDTAGTRLSCSDLYL